MEGECAWLETILNKYSNENAIKKVLSINAEAAVPEGNNYLSDIERVTITVIYGNGHKSNKTLIYKRMFKDEEKASAIKDYSIFKAEVFVYKEVLENFSKLMDEYKDYNDKLWCDLIGYRPYDLIVFEDLKAQNYILPKRQNLLDLNHTLLVMHSLGRFHALGYVLLKKGLINKDNLITNYVVDESPLTTHVMAGALKQFSDVMKRDWSPEWNEIAVRLAKEEKLVTSKLKELFEINDDCFLTVGHGDVWTCNILFKYCPYDDKFPIALKFVDYQNTNANSYIIDIVTFLYTSVQPVVRRIDMDRIFSVYQKSLQSTLAHYGMEEKAPNLEHVYAEMKRTEYFALITTITGLPVICSNIDKPFTFENLNFDYHEKNAYNPEIFNDKQFKKCIEGDLKYFMEQGVF